MPLTLRVRPVHLTLCALLFLSSLPPALGVGAAHAASSSPPAAAATPASSPSATISPLSTIATTTATASLSPAVPVTASPTITVSPLPASPIDAPATVTASATARVSATAVGTMATVRASATTSVTATPSSTGTTVGSADVATPTVDATLPEALVSPHATVVDASPPTAPVSSDAPLAGALPDASGPVSTTTTGGGADAFASLPVSYEPNVGQAPAGVSYVARGGGMTALISPTGAALVLARPTRPLAADVHSPLGSATALSATAPLSVSVVRLDWLGSTIAPSVTPGAPLPGVANYVIGNDPRAWHTGVPTYAGVTVHNLYPGVDLVYHSTGGQLEYDYDLAPGVDVGAVLLRVSGARGLGMSARGDLTMDTPLGRLVQPVPVAVQGTTPVRVRYALAPTGVAGTVGLVLGPHDPTKPVTIDPVLRYGTLLGGSGTDVARGIALDPTGTAYVTGRTSSTNFPTTGGPAYGGGDDDSFVVKLTPDGHALVYSTYLGGNNFDEGASIAADAAGRAYVTGRAYSTNFPTTANAFQSAGGAGFVAMLNPNGTLGYSSYVGNMGQAIAVDGAGDAYVGGYTDANTPANLTAGAYATTYAGGVYDGFVLKVNPLAATGTSALIYGTYLGGSGQDNLTGIAVDSGGNAYVTGDTASTDYPTTPGAYNRTGSTAGAVFLTKLSADGSHLVYSTFIGLAGTTGLGYGVAVDGAGAAYVAGTTSSPAFPSLNAAQPAYGGGPNDGFICKMNAAGSGLVYSTFLGGAGDDQALGVAVDGRGNADVSGTTASTNMITSPTALQSSNAGGYDAFVTTVAASGTTLLYSSYLGGVGNDAGNAIAVDGAGAAYVAGSSDAGQAAGNFPTTGLQSASAGGTDAFVTRLPTRPQAGLNWATRLTALPRLESGAAASFGLDGTLYVVGGTDGVQVDYRAADLYHPATDTWTVGATYPISVEGAAAVTLPDGRIVVLGGGSGCHFQQTSCTIYHNVYAYDPRTGGPWVALAPLQTARYDAAAVVRNGLIYVIGGWDGSQTLASVEVYNPSANTWTPGTALPQAEEAPGATVDSAGTIYVVGGTNGISTSGCASYNTLYTSTGGAWSARPALPTARGNLMAALGPDGQLYAIGGYSGAEGCNVQAGFRATVEVYNPGTMTWATAQPLSASVCRAGVAVAPSGQIYILGGNGLLGQRAQVQIGTLAEADGGAVPWHPHQTVRLDDHLSASVDLADGHADVTVDGLSIPGRGPDLTLTHTWDSRRAQETGLTATAAGQGWSGSLTPSMGGVLTDTVVYTADDGATWYFPYREGDSRSRPALHRLQQPAGAAVGAGDLAHHRLHTLQHPDRRNHDLRRAGALAGRYRRLRQPELTDGGDEPAHERDQQRRPVARLHLQRSRAAGRRPELAVAKRRGGRGGEPACRVRLQRAGATDEPDAWGGHGRCADRDIRLPGPAVDQGDDALHASDADVDARL